MDCKRLRVQSPPPLQVDACIEQAWKAAEAGKWETMMLHMDEEARLLPQKLSDTQPVKHCTLRYMMVFLENLEVFNTMGLCCLPKPEMLRDQTEEDDLFLGRVAEEVEGLLRRKLGAEPGLCVVSVFAEYRVGPTKTNPEFFRGMWMRMPSSPAATLSNILGRALPGICSKWFMDLECVETEEEYGMKLPKGKWREMDPFDRLRLIAAEAMAGETKSWHYEEALKKLKLAGAYPIYQYYIDNLFADDLLELKGQAMEDGEIEEYLCIMIPERVAKYIKACCVDK